MTGRGRESRIYHVCPTRRERQRLSRAWQAMTPESLIDRTFCEDITAIAVPMIHRRYGRRGSFALLRAEVVLLSAPGEGSVLMSLQITICAHADGPFSNDGERSGDNAS